MSNNNSNAITTHGNNSTNGNNGVLFEPIVSPSQFVNQKTINRDVPNRSETDTSQSILLSTTTHLIHNNSTNNSNDAHSNNDEAKHVHQKNDEKGHEKNDEDDTDFNESIRQSNLQARKIIFQDIRRPGRDYSQLLEHLGLIKGNLQTKLKFIQMCIEESQRFRRKKMADCIQEWFQNQFN